MFTIEKGITMPKPRSPTHTYPFADMEIGDSFVVPKKIGEAARVASVKYAKKGKKFSSRADGDGIRIWRIA